MTNDRVIWKSVIQYLREAQLRSFVAFGSSG